MKELEKQIDEPAKLNEESEIIFNLRPVTFNYIQDDSHTKQWGLIAEEVYEAFPELAVVDENNNPMSVRYHDLAVLLLNEMQKMRIRVVDLEKKVAQYEVCGS